jgi:hypothetical protein
MPADLLAYERAKAARVAAEALLAIVTPGLRWESLKPALAHLTQLQAEEAACFQRCLPEGSGAAYGGSYIAIPA